MDDKTTITPETTAICIALKFEKYSEAVEYFEGYENQKELTLKCIGAREALTSGPTSLVAQIMLGNAIRGTVIPTDIRLSIGKYLHEKSTVWEAFNYASEEAYREMTNDLFVTVNKMYQESESPREFANELMTLDNFRRALVLTSMIYFAFFEGK